MTFKKKEQSIGPIMFRWIWLKKGEMVEGHAHLFDHVTIVWEGSVQVTMVNEKREPIKEVVKKATPPENILLIQKGIQHSMVALEDSLVSCTYPHRDQLTREVTEEVTGWRGAYL